MISNSNDLESISETMELESNPEFMKKYLQAKKDIEENNLYSFEEVFSLNSENNE